MVKEKHFNLLRNIRKHYHIFNTTVVAMLIFKIYPLWVLRVLMKSFKELAYYWYQLIFCTYISNSDNPQLLHYNFILTLFYICVCIYLTSFYRNWFNKTFTKVFQYQLSPTALTLLLWSPKPNAFNPFCSFILLSKFITLCCTSCPLNHPNTIATYQSSDSGFSKWNEHI